MRPFTRLRSTGAREICRISRGLTRKMVPIAGERAHSLKFFKPPISIQIKSKWNTNTIHSIFLLSSSASKANPSCVIATIFTSLAFLTYSVSMTNLSHWVLQSCSFSSSISMANQSCLLAATFSSLRLLSNSLSSPRFHLLRVGRRCYSWFSVFLLSGLILSISFLCSSITEALFALSFSFLSAFLSMQKLL